MQETVADKLIAKVKDRMKHLRLGHSLDKCIDMGPIVDESQRKSISEFVDDARRDGADVSIVFALFYSLIVIKAAR